MRIILPCAGYGRRFAEAGYKIDKPLIEVNGKTLLEWSLEPIPKEWRKIFITRDDQHMDVHREVKRHGFRLVLPGPTGGAAMTVLAAAVAIPPDEPVAIMNCDQWFKCDLVKLTSQALEESWDGYILTFDGKGSQWSYAVCNPARPGMVVSVVEKPHAPLKNAEATVGFYWWRRTSDLIRCICTMIANNDMVNNEYYLAPAYNTLLKWGTNDVRAVMVDEFAGLGTPEQVRSFEQAALVMEP